MFWLQVWLLHYGVCFPFVGYYNHSQGQIQSQKNETSHDMQVLVTGTTGISWRKKPVAVSKTVSQEEFQ